MQKLEWGGGEVAETGVGGGGAAETGGGGGGGWGKRVA